VLGFRVQSDFVLGTAGQLIVMGGGGESKQELAFDEGLDYFDNRDCLGDAGQKKVRLRGGHRHLVFKRL